MEQTTDDEASTLNEMDKTQKSTTEFKRPILIGKIGKLPKKITTTKAVEETEQTIKDIPIEEHTHNEELERSDAVPQPIPVMAPVQQILENSVPLPYKEPPWSGLPRSTGAPYMFEVLKSGVIVDRIDLMSKPFWLFGRATNCEIYMAHPTISRYHAVLQYRSEGATNYPPGFYIYDLSSTHGTFLNKNQLKSRVYAPVKVGHMIKLGFSSRSYILTGPEDDSEEESQFTVTQLNQQRIEKILKRKLEEQEALAKAEQEREAKRKRDEERGIDWGLGEDADEETDLTENPFAQTNNEELYIDDPKKALRGFMEREGHDLEYDCTEQGFGQFLCKVELPIDDDFGRPIVAEVLHKGKKKEAVVQCALEACKILDRYGVLRQATHESRKRKAKNWEENDYYDSDDDTYLDRTGTIEKKREKRMQAKVPQQPETYQSLLEKEKQINQEIQRIERELARGANMDSAKSSSIEEDSLDSFMKELKQSKPDKHMIRKLKSELASLKMEHAKIVKLVNLTKPADLPALIVHSTSGSERQSTSKAAKTKALPMIGKRLKGKLLLPARPKDITDQQNEEEEEEEDENVSEPVENKASASGKSESPESTQKQNENTTKVPHHLHIYTKIQYLDKLIGEHEFPPILQTCISDIKDWLQEVTDAIEDRGKIETNRKTVMAKGIKTKKHIDNLYESYDESSLIPIRNQLRRIFADVQEISEKEHGLCNRLRLLCTKFDLISKQFQCKIDEMNSSVQSARATKSKDGSENSEDEDDDDKEVTQEELERRRKRNQKRIQQRKEKAEKEKQKGYREDARKADYNMWVPPQNQTGDGRTSLNEKYGY